MREKIKNVFAKRFHLPTKSVGFQVQFAARPVEGGFVMLMPKTSSGTAAHHCLVSIERNLSSITHFTGKTNQELEIRASKLLVRYD